MSFASLRPLVLGDKRYDYMNIINLKINVTVKHIQILEYRKNPNNID